MGRELAASPWVPFSPFGPFQRAGNYRSAHGQIQLDNLLCDGFLRSITTKIHQTEPRGFTAGNRGAKRSVIGLSHGHAEHAIENEAALPVIGSRPMAQTGAPESAGLPATVPEGPTHWPPQGGEASLSLPVPGCSDGGMSMLAHACRSTSTLIILGA